MNELKVEINGNYAESPAVKGLAKSGVLITPPVGPDNWLIRVKASEKQAIIGFPKFCTIGIGFAEEENWNTNLPYTSEAEEIFNHIEHNKSDDNIKDSICIEAIKLVQDTAKKLKSD